MLERMQDARLEDVTAEGAVGTAAGTSPADKLKPGLEREAGG